MKTKFALYLLAFLLMPLYTYAQEYFVVGYIENFRNNGKLHEFIDIPCNISFGKLKNEKGCFISIEIQNKKDYIQGINLPAVDGTFVSTSSHYYPYDQNYSYNNNVQRIESDNGNWVTSYTDMVSALIVDGTGKGYRIHVKIGNRYWLLRIYNLIKQNIYKEPFDLIKPDPNKPYEAMYNCLEEIFLSVKNISVNKQVSISDLIKYPLGTKEIKQMINPDSNLWDVDWSDILDEVKYINGWHTSVEDHGHFFIVSAKDNFYKKIGNMLSLQGNEMDHISCHSDYHNKVDSYSYSFQKGIKGIYAKYESELSKSQSRWTKGEAIDLADKLISYLEGIGITMTKTKTGEGHIYTKIGRGETNACYKVDVFYFHDKYFSFINVSLNVISPNSQSNPFRK